MAIMNVDEVQVKVRRVKVSGLCKTKNDIVTEQVKGILSATNLKELLEEALKSYKRLESLNIFKEIDLQFDRSQGKEDGAVVTFLVKECGVFSASILANAGTQSGDASLSFALRNLCGRAEQLRTVSSTAFPHWGSTFNVEFNKPYYRDIEKRLTAALGTTSYRQPACGYQEYIIGPRMELNWPSWLGRHRLLWSGDWREIYGIDHGVPLSIRQETGHTLKSSIKHVLEKDMRDDPQLPSNGHRTMVTQEVAGLGGDVVFSKVDMQTEMYKEIYPNWVLGLSLRCGVIRPFKNLRISDKFLLGGPTTVRGFQMWGIGPREQGYSKGGEAYWASGVHLLTPLPYTNGEFFRRIRLHTFLTSGNLVQCKNLSELTELVRNVRLSYGVGVNLRLGEAQIEINYVLPIKAQPQDSLKPGLQFGIGIDLL